MKFAFTADWHMKDNVTEQLVEYETGERIIHVGAQLFEKAMVLQELITEARKKLADEEEVVIIVGGDIKHYPFKIDTNSLMVLSSIIDNNPDITFWFITGNHDLTHESEKSNNFLYILRTRNNVNVVDMGETITLPNAENVYMTSYHPDLKEAFRRLGEEIDPDVEKRILISHFGVSEAAVTRQVRIKGDIDMKHADGMFDLILLGHYHKPQMIEGKKAGTKLYYSGNLIQEDWGERDEDKRFLIVDTETLEVESIPFTHGKKHIIMDYKDVDFSKIEELNEKYYLKVVCKKDDDVAVLINNDVKFEVESIDIFSESTNVMEGTTDEEIIQEYMEKTGIEEDVQEKYIKVLSNEILTNTNIFNEYKN